MDAATFLGERSKEIEALEASGDAVRNEVWAPEGRLREEEALHRELQASLYSGEEEARELEARAEGLSEEALKLRTELAKGGRRDAFGAEEVRALWDQSTAEAAAIRERISEPAVCLVAKNISNWRNAGPRSRRCKPSSTRAQGAQM